MRGRASLIAALVAALLALTACASAGPAAGTPPTTQRDGPDRGSSDHGGGGM